VSLLNEPRAKRLETGSFRPYGWIMDNKPDNTPHGWSEILDESEAEIDAGLFVSSEQVHRELQESIARLEAKAAIRKRETTSHR
jgi:hypothetical protein